MRRYCFGPVDSARFGAAERTNEAPQSSCVTVPSQTDIPDGAGFERPPAVRPI
jgi:hypothetical protein